jgi:hypothetical protein
MELIPANPRKSTLVILLIVVINTEIGCLWLGDLNE